jgi:predicted O-linked N-acetylglucosamine transferase (SPINDLY family)
MSFSRYGVSLLSNLGVNDLIAATPEAYVEKAVALATDRKRLIALRAELRPRMAASPLCDAKGCTRNVEQAYREMWRRWCQSGT